MREERVLATVAIVLLIVGILTCLGLWATEYGFGQAIQEITLSGDDWLIVTCREGTAMASASKGQAVIHCLVEPSDG